MKNLVKFNELKEEKKITPAADHKGGPGIAVGFAAELKKLGIGDGSVSKDTNLPGVWFIDNDSNLQLHYVVSGDYGQKGFQFADEDGREIYIGKDPKKALEKLLSKHFITTKFVVTYVGSEIPDAEEIKKCLKDHDEWDFAITVTKMKK